MLSRTALTCNHYAAGCTKTEPEILQVKRGQKQRNAPDSARKRRNRVRFGCWRGWQRLGTDKTRCEKPKFEPKRTPFPCTTCKKKPGRNTVFPPGLCVFFPKMMRPTKREVKKTRIYAVFKHFCFLKSSTFQKRCGKLEGQF